jgi:hypothetical protein
MASAVSTQPTTTSAGPAAPQPSTIATILNPIIKYLLNEKVSFNPTTRAPEIDPSPISLDAVLEAHRIREDLEDPVAAYVKSLRSGWSTAPVFSGLLAQPVPVTKLIIRNLRGFNPDCRSHRGDDLPQDFQIPAKTPKKPYIPHGYRFYGDYIGDSSTDIKRHNFVLALDEATYQPFWRVEAATNPGVTWGQVMEGVMRVKGSKFDKWYELFCDVEVSFPFPDTVELSLTFDHGS